MPEDYAAVDESVTAGLDIKCKNVWVWEVARFVMLVWHDS